MALSNRDRIGRMFDVLAPALDAFIQRVVAPELTADADWTMLVALRDQQKGISGKAYERHDAYVQLRMLSEGITGQVKPGWYPFRDHLSRSQESFASELRDARNAWAHGKPFSPDDTYRTLDTAERLLRAVGAVEAADRVGEMRTELRRVSSEQEDRRADRAVEVHAESAGLPPWREVLRPHDDVATGNFRASEFAADLYKVSQQDSDQGREYTDPVEFFARTYLTAGLRDLIGWAVARLTGNPNAAPVINLQTNFGGGKTHSMLALWHLAAGRPIDDHPQAVQEVLAANGYPDAGQPPLRVNRAALVGNHLAPTGSVKADGTQVNTIWGELAWQLGGRTAYDLVAEADRTSTHSGEALHRLLATYAPAVILVDEWVAYARQLFDREGLPGGTFDTQFTFAQSLTEAVKATPGVLVAISIPASYEADDTRAASAEEVGGENGREALRRLQNVVRRVADQWQPATAQESYEIVRRRLFTEPDAAALAAIRRTAREFCAFYVKHSQDFPREVRETEYEERIRRSYPIHPELFERLYEDWSTLDRFQRTRGVLRLMNHVIHALWSTGDTAPLIMPGSIPLSAPVVNSELTQYLSDAWRPIISADVDGENSVPAAIDRERPVFGQRSLTKRLARTVFFGAAPTVGSAHVGLETPRIFLGTAVPGDVPGNFGSALGQLADRATYFYASSGRYWYDTQANISRRAKDQAERLTDDEVWADIVRRLETQRRTRGGFAAVSAAPEGSGDIPDVDEVRLVLVHPRYGYSRRAKAESPASVFAHDATARHGSGHRVNRNMVVFLAADDDRLAELAVSIRQFLAWSAVAAGADELNLTVAQVAQAGERRARADQTASERLLGAYHWVLVPEQKDAAAPFGITEIKAEGTATSLAERATRKLQHGGQLSEAHTSRLVRLDLDGVLASVWAPGHVSVGELWSYYARYPYLRRLRDRSMLSDAVRVSGEQLHWRLEGFALAESYDEATGRYAGLVLPQDRTVVSPIHDGLLIVRPERAESQRAADEAAQPDPAPPSLVVDPAPGPGVRSGAGSTAGQAAVLRDADAQPRALRRRLQEGHRRGDRAPGIRAQRHAAGEHRDRGRGRRGFRRRQDPHGRRERDDTAVQSARLRGGVDGDVVGRRATPAGESLRRIHRRRPAGAQAGRLQRHRVLSDGRAVRRRLRRDPSSARRPATHVVRHPAAGRD